MKEQGFKPRTPDIDGLITGVESLGSLPEVYLRLTEKLSAPVWSAAQVAAILVSDADLTARVLRLANNPFHGVPGKVDRVSRAITVIGADALHSLMWASSAVRLFSHLPRELMSMADFWRHSVYTAVVARTLAHRCNVLHAERVFVAGVLHDLGRLVLCQRLPEVMVEVLGAPVHGEARARLERGALGFDHADVGAALVERWGLPAGLSEAVGLHHRPGAATRSPLEVAIVHVADTLAHAVERETALEAAVREMDPRAVRLTGMDVALAEQLVGEAGGQFAEALEFILPQPAV